MTCIVIMHFGSAMRILCDFCKQVHAVEEGARREESLMKSKVDINSARGRQSSYVGAADAGSASTDLWIIISVLGFYKSICLQTKSSESVDAHGQTVLRILFFQEDESFTPQLQHVSYTLALAMISSSLWQQKCLERYFRKYL